MKINNSSKTEPHITLKDGLCNSCQLCTPKMILKFPNKSPSLNRSEYIKIKNKCFGQYITFILTLNVILFIYNLGTL